MKKTYYIFNHGKIRRKDNTLQFVSAEGDARSIPIENIFDIYVFSEIDLNTKVINFLSSNRINIHFFNYYGFYTSSLYAKERYISGNLLVKQVEYYNATYKRLELAKEILKASCFNIYRNLRYYSSRGRDHEDSKNKIDYMIKKFDKCKSINEIMGVEGNIRKIYYSQWEKILVQDIEFEKRVKRPPNNIVNTMISFLNSLFYTAVLSQIYHTHLNPTVSYLHEPGVSRFSLSLDISEVFKPIVIDRLIFRMLNRNQIQEKHFNKGLNFLHLNDKGKRIILEEYDKSLNETIYHKILKKRVSYKYLIRLECYKIVKHLMSEKEYEGFRIWW